MIFETTITKEILVQDGNDKALVRFINKEFETVVILGRLEAFTPYIKNVKLIELILQVIKQEQELNKKGE